MKKIFLIPLMAFAFCVGAYAGNEAKIGNTEYATLKVAIQDGVPELSEEAYESAPETEITLIDDVNTSSVLRIPSNKKVKLNLAGHSITSAFIGEGWDVCDETVIDNRGTLHIVSEGNSIIQKTVGNNDAFRAAVLTNDGTGTLIIDGGTFVGGWCQPGFGQSFKLPIIWAYDKNTSDDKIGKIIINGGVFTCAEDRSDYAVGPIFGCIAGGGEWHINGGIFSTSEETPRYAAMYEGSLLTTGRTNAKHTPTNFSGKINTATHRAIDVPYTNRNIPGYYDRANHPDMPAYDVNNGKTYLLPIKYVYVVCPVASSTWEAAGESDAVDIAKTTSKTLASGEKKINFLFVDSAAVLTIKSGATLHVGAGGIVMGRENSKIVIEEGGTLIADNDIITSNYGNIELTMDATHEEDGNMVGKFANLLIKAEKIQGSHPNATVKLISKGHGDGSAWQRFAVPTYSENALTRKDGISYDESSYKTAIYRWDYNSNGWEVMLRNSTEYFKPFQCYDMTTQNPNPGHEYTFKCELVGNGDAQLEMPGDKWNYFANSHTAPIDITEMLWDLFVNPSYKDNVAASVYVHSRTQKAWDVVSFADVLDGKVLKQEKIQPMQAFVFQKLNEINYFLDYTNLIYNPSIGVVRQHAPRRRSNVALDYQRATILITDAEGNQDFVKFYEGNEFDNTLNNGFDVEKLMNEGQFNMYVSAEEGNMARLASDKIENAMINLQTKEATTFIMSFENTNLEGYAVRDNLTGTEVEIAEGNTYDFATLANASVEGRFEIVPVAKAPTAIEDVEVNANVKGIYSLTGQYLGENFHALPAGVYVVNGKKVVK